jgi:hypothetical protein
MLAPADLGPPTQVQAAQSRPGSLTVLGKTLVPARKAAVTETAPSLDPDNVEALVERAWVDVDVVANWLSDDRAKHLRSAEADLTRALKLRPHSANAHCALGASRIVSNRAVQGIAQCERAGN